MTSLTTYTFDTNNIRTVERNGEPWFMVADVCRVLAITNTSQAVESISADRKAMLNIGLRGRAPWMVNEAGLYDLVLQSRKPDAQAFKQWVTGTVLPAIRKDGAYVMGEE